MRGRRQRERERDGNREENGEEQCVGVESQGGKRLLQRREGKKRGRRVNILGKYVCTHKRVQREKECPSPYFHRGGGATNAAVDLTDGQTARAARQRWAAHG